MVYIGEVEMEIDRKAKEIQNFAEDIRAEVGEDLDRGVVSTKAHAIRNQANAIINLLHSLPS